MEEKTQPKKKIFKRTKKRLLAQKKAKARWQKAKSQPKEIWNDLHNSEESDSLSEQNHALPSELPGAVSNQDTEASKGLPSMEDNYDTYMSEYDSDSDTNMQENDSDYFPTVYKIARLMNEIPGRILAIDDPEISQK